MKHNYFFMLKKLAFIGILCIFCGTDAAWARSKFTITPPTSTVPTDGSVYFTITRDDATKMEAVIARCVSITASIDMHYSCGYQELFFMPGQYTAEYGVREYTSYYIDAINNDTYAYQYGPESFRTYRVEVLDITGEECLASCEKIIDYGEGAKWNP